MQWHLMVSARLNYTLHYAHAYLPSVTAYLCVIMCVCMMLHVAGLAAFNLLLFV